MSTGLSLADAEVKLESLDFTQPITDINDALELYNIVEMFKSDARLPRWSDEYYYLLKDKALTILSLLGRFFSSIGDENITDTFNAVDADFIDDFWNLFSYFNLQKRISVDVFGMLLTSDLYRLRPLFNMKNIVDAYPNQLTTLLTSSEIHAEMLIDSFLSYRQFGPDMPLFLPSVFSLEMREQLISKYIVWPEANLNYIKLLFESRDNKNLRLSIKTKHAAQMQYDSMSREFFSERSGGHSMLSCEIRFDANQEDPINESVDSKGKTTIVYAQKWFDSNLDFPTLWNNFLHIFSFVDCQSRCQFVSNPNKHSIILKNVGVRGKTAYDLDLIEQFNNNVYSLKLRSYLGFLQMRNIYINELISWFFNSYLPEEFHVRDFLFNAPTKGTTYLEKCKLLATEIDSILKQFETYVLESKVDRALFEFNSDHIKIKNIASSIPNKYFYASSSDCRVCMHYLFSNQSHLKYTKKSRGTYRSLYELLQNQNITKDDFHDYNAPYIDFLISQSCLHIDDDRFLRLNHDRLLILFDLYENQVCCNSYFLDVDDEVRKLFNAGDIRFASTLFSEPEQDYISYILTQSDFSNGLDLRNRYVHGNYPANPEQHGDDYLEFLKVLVLIIIKINEEFCLRDELANKPASDDSKQPS
jgi:hypothetical protein